MSQSIALQDLPPVRALRLIDTRNLSREAWLQARKQGIGASDAAAAVGLSPYRSPLELWLDKTSQDESALQSDSTNPSEPMYWGTRLEPLVAAAYAEQTGRKVRKVNAILRHPRHSFMLANLDREVVGDPEVRILECKTAGEYGAKAWKDGVPEHIQLQVQHQLAVTGGRAADVAVLLAGQKLEVFRINRDDVLIGRLIELEAAFWQKVVNRQAPEADGSESADRALRALFLGTGGSVDFTQHPVLNNQFSELLLLKDQIQGLVDRAEVLRQHIQQAMGEATEASFINGRVTFRRSKEGIQVDLDRLRQEQPALLANYQIVRPGTRRFRICDVA